MLAQFLDEFFWNFEAKKVCFNIQKLHNILFIFENVASYKMTKLSEVYTLRRVGEICDLG